LRRVNSQEGGRQRAGRLPAGTLTGGDLHAEITRPGAARPPSNPDGFSQARICGQSVSSRFLRRAGRRWRLDLVVAGTLNGQRRLLQDAHALGDLAGFPTGRGPVGRG
jgi:hypothetical protein